MRYHSSVTPIPMTVGQQVYLAGDLHPWTVKAFTEHFAAFTRPVDDSYRGVASHDWPELEDEYDGDVQYTVLDWRNGVRGPCDLSGQGWGDGTYSASQCAGMLADFEAGDLEVSHRNNVRIEFGEVTR